MQSYDYGLWTMVLINVLIFGDIVFLMMRGAGCGMGHGRGDHAQEGDREDQKNSESCH